MLKNESIKWNEVSITFVSEKEICSLHKKYFNDPSSTDCISFPIDSEYSEYSILGEVFVCPKVAIEYATKHKNTPGKELTLYIVHGLLHLIGYDDISEKERKIMRKKEAYHINLLQKENLILSLS